MHVKGQASMEYMVLIGALLVILIPLFYYAISTSSNQINLRQAEDTVGILAQAADEVYALSKGTKKFVWVNIPGGVQSSQVVSKEIVLTISVFQGTSEVLAVTRANVTGEVPIQKGRYKMSLEHLNSSTVLVEIS
jgi:uncharacterized protein (UPF0333 family)